MQSQAQSGRRKRSWQNPGEAPAGQCRKKQSNLTPPTLLVSSHTSPSTLFRQTRNKNVLPLDSRGRALRPAPRLHQRRCAQVRRRARHQARGCVRQCIQPRASGRQGACCFHCRYVPFSFRSTPACSCIVARRQTRDKTDMQQNSGASCPSTSSSPPSSSPRQTPGSSGTSTGSTRATCPRSRTAHSTRTRTCGQRRTRGARATR